MSEYKMLKKVGMIGLAIVGVRIAFKAYFDSHDDPKYPADFPEDPDDEESLENECEDEEDGTEAWAIEILDAAAKARERDD